MINLKRIRGGGSLRITIIEGSFGALVLIKWIKKLINLGGNAE